jgi:hypothetical protein
MSATVRSRKTGRVLHQTTTSKPRPGRPATAFCNICGWSQAVEPPGGRSEARVLARAHLRWPDEWPIYDRGVADTGDPSNNTAAAPPAGGALAATTASDASSRTHAAVRANRRTRPTEAGASSLVISRGSTRGPRNGAVLTTTCLNGSLRHRAPTDLAADTPHPIPVANLTVSKPARPRSADNFTALVVESAPTS